MASIYGLYDAEGRLRYIGKANDPRKRLAQHMREARRRKTPLYDWIKARGKPEMRVIEADCQDWEEAERRLIAEARARGERLLNLASGGDEPSCPREVRQANGRAVWKVRDEDVVERRIYEMKRKLGCALSSGLLLERHKAMMRQAARKAPHIFGLWANL